MATTVVLKLNKAASEFQAGESVGFGIRGGVQYYDHKTKQKEWTNYSAVVFVRNQGQIDFYRSALVEGAIVEAGGKTQKIEMFDGQNGPVYSIELQDAWLGAIHAPQNAQPQQAAYQQAPQQGFQQPAQPQYNPNQPPPPPANQQMGVHQAGQPQQKNQFNQQGDFDPDLPF